MQQMVQKDRELHEQQAMADHLRRQFASDPANQSPELGGDAARAEGLVQACKQEYKQLEVQADRKASMVRYLSDQVQERSEDVREAQQLLTTEDGRQDAAVGAVRDRAARSTSCPTARPAVMVYLMSTGLQDIRREQKL